MNENKGFDRWNLFYKGLPRLFWRSKRRTLVFRKTQIRLENVVDSFSEHHSWSARALCRDPFQVSFDLERTLITSQRE